MRQKILLVSKSNDLSKIFNAMYYNKLTKVIPSPHHYYDPQTDEFKKILTEREVTYSILRVCNNNKKNNNNATTAKLVKLRSGFIALKIPYLKLIRLFKY